MEKKLLGLSRAQKERMLKIIFDLKKKMKELDKLKEDIEYKHISFSLNPKQTKALIEEIKVPSIELIRSEGKQK